MVAAQPLIECFTIGTSKCLASVMFARAVAIMHTELRFSNIEFFLQLFGVLGLQRLCCRKASIQKNETYIKLNDERRHVSLLSILSNNVYEYI